MVLRANAASGDVEFIASRPLAFGSWRLALAGVNVLVYSNLKQSNIFLD